MTSTKAIDVTQLTIVDIQQMVTTCAASPSDILDCYLSRLEDVEDAVQAWSYLDIEGARSTAAQLSDEAQRGILRGPLHGVPVGVKDEFHVQGMPTYFADPEGKPQPEDATCVRLLRESGAIIVGKTHMPVGGKLPPTRNPWNLAHTAGGTSSGSGAAVAARMVPLALGEQTAGSNLRPAAYCGLAGIKPTFGRISRFGCYQFSYSHDHAGLIGLTMADLALVLSVVAGPDERDRTALSAPAPDSLVNLPGMRPPRIGVVRNFYPQRTQPVMQAAIDRAATKLREAGADVRDVLLPGDFELIWMVHRIVGSAEAANFHSRLYAQPGAGQSTRNRVAEALPATYYLQAQRIRHKFWLEIQESFSDLDAWLVAAAPGEAPKGLSSTGDASLLVPWSCLGYPAVTLNGGLSPEGLPLGLQFVARPLADHDLLRAGAWCESVLGRLPAPAIRKETIVTP
jgi:Asp-tRNA(Asn)/Glu-tRNA(Gln) amidotransferase A subunit family amidase